MGTKTVNTAAGTAIANRSKAYDPDNLIRYHAILGMVEKLADNGILTAADYRRSCTILSRKYGLPANSIFAEIA